MPELPEVESARRLVEAHGAGRVVSDVIALEQGGGPRSGLFDDIIFSGCPSADAVKDLLVGRTLVAAQRRGKQMWWTFSGDGPTLLCHFGMTGSVSVLPPGRTALVSKYKSFTVDAKAWPPRFTKLEVVFSDRTRIAFSDPRRLGRILLLQGDVLAQSPLSVLGPDAWTGLPPLEHFARMCRSRDIPIKALLLDQGFLAGIGNWIADEVLYQSRVHPESISSALDDAALAALRGAIEHVISTACAADADAERFPPEWLFHRRWEKGKSRPRTHDGHPIEFLTVGGRTSAVIPALQKRVASRAGVPKSASASADASRSPRGGIKRKAMKPDAEAGAQRDALAATSLAAVHERRGASIKGIAVPRSETEGLPMAPATLGKRRR